MYMYHGFFSDFHEVKKVKVGLPVSHDPHSYEHIQWKVRPHQLNPFIPNVFSIEFYFKAITSVEHNHLPR